MGLNIMVSKILKKEIIDGWHGDKHPFYHTEEVPWFDSLRFSGDKDFVLENEFDLIDKEDDDRLMRPVDFDKCRTWVAENIQPNLQFRLINALDEMEQDESLVLHWSW